MMEKKKSWQNSFLIELLLPQIYLFSCLGTFPKQIVNVNPHLKPCLHKYHNFHLPSAKRSVDGSLLHDDRLEVVLLGLARGAGWETSTTGSH